MLYFPSGKWTIHVWNQWNLFFSKHCIFSVVVWWGLWMKSLFMSRQAEKRSLHLPSWNIRKPLTSLFSAPWGHPHGLTSPQGGSKSCKNDCYKKGQEMVTVLPLCLCTYQLFRWYLHCGPSHWWTHSTVDLSSIFSNVVVIAILKQDINVDPCIQN